MNEAHNCTLAVTLWRTFSRGRHTRYTWREFVDTFVAQPEIVRDKKKVAGFSLGSFTGNRRALSRVEAVHALILDFDCGDTTLEQAARLLPGAQGVAHTTFSHKPTHPKLRAVFLLSRPVLADEYARIWSWAESRISRAGHVLDEAARDASRFWYLPSHRPGAPYEWREFAGKPIDVEKALSEAPPSRPLPVGGAQRRTPIGRGREVCALDDGGGTFFGTAFAFAGLAFEPADNGALPVVCPWRDTHTSGFDGDSSTVIFPATTDGGWGLFHCSHAHCAQRKTSDLLDVLPRQALNAARTAHGRGLLRVKVVHGWKEWLDEKPGVPALERFVLRCRPDAGPIFAMTVKPGSVFHRYLDELSVKALIGRRIDVSMEGSAVKAARLVP
jgi:hypothetical protein